MSGHKRRTEYHCVTRYEVVQLMPSTGIRAAFEEEDGTVSLEPVVALAVCRVYDDRYRSDGKLIQHGKPNREVCGIATGEDFFVCEGAENHLGYLAPGAEIPDAWKAKA